MPREEKAREVAALEERLSRASSVVLAEFQGLTVAQENRMRRELAPRGLELRVVKNTLFRIAAQEVGVSGLEPHLRGTTAVVFGYGDPVEAPRAVSGFQRELAKELRVKAGLLGRQVLDAEAVRALAELPGREVLLGRLAGTLAAPLRQVAATLRAPLDQLAFGLMQLKTKREAQA